MNNYKDITDAMAIVKDLRIDFAGGVCPPVWEKLYRVHRYLEQQQGKDPRTHEIEVILACGELQ